MAALQDTAALLDEDLIGILTNMGGGSDAAMLAGLYERFASDARQALVRMREQARQGCDKQLVREAHRLRGSGGSIGASGFARDCFEIEQRARGAGVAELEVCILDAQQQLEATVVALRSLIGPVAGNIAEVAAGS